MEVLSLSSSHVILVLTELNWFPKFWQRYP